MRRLDVNPRRNDDFHRQIKQAAKDNLGGPEDELNLVNRISELFVGGNLVTKIGMQLGVYSIETIGITNTDTPFVPPLQP